jgi:leucyl-tRNA synthetase
MSDEIWDWLLVDGPWPSSSPIPRDKADALKHEYEYFYPFDLRSSAKDLITNHLSFCLYVHVALFPKSKWPLSIRANGYLMLNGKKMSKSTGNSLTLKEGVEKFGADAMRLSLADAGDGIEDANFDEKTANANILRVHTLLGWCEVSGEQLLLFLPSLTALFFQDTVVEKSKLRGGPRNYHDRVFEEEIKDLVNITQSHYEAWVLPPRRRCRSPDRVA